LGGDYPDDIVERARAKAVAKGQVNTTQALIDARREAEEEEQAKRKIVRASVSWHSRTVNPFDVLDIAPRREPGWFKGKLPTPRMIEVLERAGIPTQNVSFFQAQQLIASIIKRREKGLCTFKQAKVLARYGHSPDTSFEEARKIMDALARNGWQRATVS
jgi:hypothetical protein